MSALWVVAASVWMNIAEQRLGRLHRSSCGPLCARLNGMEGCTADLRRSCGLEL